MSLSRRMAALVAAVVLGAGLLSGWRRQPPSRPGTTGHGDHLHQLDQRHDCHLG